MCRWKNRKGGSEGRRGGGVGGFWWWWWKGGSEGWRRGVCGWLGGRVCTGRFRYNRVSPARAVSAQAATRCRIHHFFQHNTLYSNNQQKEMRRSTNIKSKFLFSFFCFFAHTFTFTSAASPSFFIRPTTASPTLHSAGATIDIPTPSPPCPRHDLPARPHPALPPTTPQSPNEAAGPSA